MPNKLSKASVETPGLGELFALDKRIAEFVSASEELIAALDDQDHDIEWGHSANFETPPDCDICRALTKLQNLIDAVKA